MKFKLPLRARISISLLIMYFLNVAAILLYVNFSLSDDINNDLVDFRKDVVAKTEQIVDFLTTTDINDITQACKSIEFDEKTIIEIGDIEGETVFCYPDREFIDQMKDSNRFYFKNSDHFFFTNEESGRQIYFINVYSFAVTEISYYLLLMLILFETLVMALILVIFSFYIKMSVLNPLYELGDKIRSYKSIKNIKNEKFSNEIEQLNFEFDNLIEALETERQKQNRMIASVSHDIKTPLTSILGYAEQLKKDNISPERREKYTNTIYAKANTIKDLIANFDEFLNYNTLENSKKKEISLSTLISEVNSYFESDLRHDGVEMNTYLLSEEAVVLVNELSLVRVFGNLIDNSIKHKRKRKKLVIDIYCAQVKDDVVISFCDNGEGVPKDKIDKIFEPFYTTDESRSKAVSGLGLSICREIITEHGGEIWATESESGGLSVNFTLKKIR
ncbi:MAG: HAMP domain-containing histidine kinase [Clostridia bacterium]|nr:HAMP domain-containing histidine kinase [Clostridia bacterium]